MDTFLENKKEKQGINKILLGAVVVGFLVVAAIVGLIALRPTPQDVQQQALDGAFRENSPEFAALTKRIVAQTDVDRTTQSPTGMGTVVMSIGGTIRNLTGKTLTGLELKVGVIDSFGNPIKDKTFVVIPRQAEKLENNQTLPVQVSIDGFSREDDRANIRWKVTAIKVSE
jgi:hypothetical protein